MAVDHLGTLLDAFAASQNPWVAETARAWRANLDRSIPAVGPDTMWDDLIDGEDFFMAPANPESWVFDNLAIPPDVDADPATMSDTIVKVCANCGTTLDIPSGRRDGVAAVAWMNHCRPCAEGVAGQMELIDDRPGGAAIQLWRCIWCGLSRSCRAGWATRCHACLDDRTDLSVLGLDGIADLLRSHFPEAEDEVRHSAQLGPDEELDDADVHEWLSAAAYADELDFRTHPGWTALAGDIKGLPWIRWGTESHGFWGRHDACGTVQNLSTRECRTCPPGPGSSTHRARKDDPHLLYLVRHGDRLKVGHGDRGRILTHLRGGAKLVTVLRATFAETVTAEKAVLARHHKPISKGHTDLPRSFGTGTEVLPASAGVDLAEFLPDGIDVTGYYELLTLGVPAEENR